MKEQIFKKGDTVYWGQLKGEVTEYNDVDYPLKVIFKNGRNDFFTFDGRYDEEYPKVISFTPYTLEGFSQERPCELEDGDPVWVRNGDYDGWFAAVFKGYDKGLYFIHITKNGCANGYKQCKPFKKEK